jgi:hypothetical protein
MGLAAAMPGVALAAESRTKVVICFVLRKAWRL